MMRRKKYLNLMMKRIKTFNYRLAKFITSFDKKNEN